MKFLFDENLPPSFCPILRQLGYAARHVYDINFDGKPDEEIVEFARLSGEIIVTNDLDFSRILSLSGAQKPSVLTFRMPALNPNLFGEITRLNLEKLREAFKSGSLVTISEDRIRIRKLPVFAK